MAISRALICATLCLAGCHTGSANTMAAATSMTALAIGASAVNRANGGCVAICTNGTVCNTKTGWCDVLPCRGQCNFDEHCEESFTGGKCVPGGTTGVATAASQTGETKLPVAEPWVPQSSGPPEVVPKAEQQPPSSKAEGK